MGGEESPEICAHQLCHCPPAGPNDPYCSAYCANVAFEDETQRSEDGSACSCGHVTCLDRSKDSRKPPSESPIAMGGGPGSIQPPD